MSDAQLMQRPRRWDAPFDPQMSESDVDALLARSEFTAIYLARFPSAAPLRGIVRNDCRVTTYAAGEIIVCEGDYGNSAFLVLDGAVRVVLPPGLPQNVLGRATEKKRSLMDMLSDALRRQPIAEMRDTALYSDAVARTDSRGEQRASLLNVPNPAALFGAGVDLSAVSGRVPPL